MSFGAKNILGICLCLCVALVVGFLDLQAGAAIQMHVSVTAGRDRPGQSVERRRHGERGSPGSRGEGPERKVR